MQHRTVSGASERRNMRWSRIATFGRGATCALLTGLYIGLCPALILGDGGGLPVAAAIWLALGVGVCGLCNLAWKQTAFVVAAAVVACTMWSLILVDFPPRWIEQAGVITQGLFVLVPFLLSPLVGMWVGERGATAGALSLTLAAVGNFPVAIWNVELSVVGGWEAYPYPQITAGVLFLVLSASTGAAGGCIGRHFRSMWNARKGTA